jgi:UDP-glucuronate decarboxylase
LIEVIIALMNSPKDITGPVNIGNPAEFRIIDLAKEILRMTGSRSPIVFTPLPSDDPKQRKPDISQAKQILGWEPKIPLQEGLQATIGYFQEKMSTPTTVLQIAD